MVNHTVEVTAASRLHFGMFSFGHPTERQFGGAGVMIAQPGLRLRISASHDFAIHGAAADRVRAAVERFVDQRGLDEPPRALIEVLELPPLHIGLGTGTQLALATVALLNAFSDGAPLDAAALASLSGRGARSAIGTHGFVQGGFLVESGKMEGETLSPLEARVELPSAWRFVLLGPRDVQGLSGAEEQHAFCRLPPVTPEAAASLRREVVDEMLPAARDGDFARFSESVYRFGHASGLCFAQSQGGAYASPRVARLVAAVRDLGIRGVGQSSWGPTVFALVESVAAAAQFVERIGAHLEPADQILIAQPQNSGARLVWGNE